VPMMQASRPGGFTLIELMVTVVVAAVLLTLAVPSFTAWLDRNRLKSAAEQLQADLQYAREEAIKRDTDVRVVFSTAAPWCYGLDDDPSTACDCSSAPANCTIGSGSAADPRVVKVVDGAQFKGIGMVSAGFAGGVSYTVFNPRRGTAEESAGAARNGTVQFRSVRGNTVSVVVARLGRVRICSDNLYEYPPCS
jgi:type IV fimbrial biogenesis protein FimT